MNFERGGPSGYREFDNDPPNYFYFGGPDVSIQIQYAHPIFKMDLRSANHHPLHTRGRVITTAFPLAEIDIIPPVNKILSRIPTFVAKDVFVSFSPELLTFGCEVSIKATLPIIETPEFPSGNLSLAVTTDFSQPELSLPEGIIVSKPTEAVREALGGLTLSELETVRLIAQGGYTNDQLAPILGTSRATATKHINNALKKMGAQNRTRAAVRAIFEGLDINKPIQRLPEQD
jgi:DNA-binding CsgD family transcriptional regulator